MLEKPLTKEVLRLDCAAAVDQISDQIRTALKRFRRRGLIVALSGGIDSSVTAALAAKAIGHKRVFGIHMPDKESATDTLQLSQSVSNDLRIDSSSEDITPVLEAVHCYSRQEAAVRVVIPQYGKGWKCKIVLDSIFDNDGFNFYHVVAQSPSGETIKRRLNSEAYLGIVAATNFKQRVRKMIEYYHADRLNYAVAGTPNRLEYDQGFFVKLGDGAADVKPIAHLYKSQIYQLADYLELPEGVRSRDPTTDTYSLPQGQGEFYFSLPYAQMDLCLYAKNHGNAASEVGPLVGLSTEQVQRVYQDIDAKRSATEYLQAKPVLIEAVPEIDVD
jgi:NAD+ synthase